MACLRGVGGGSGRCCFNRPTGNECGFPAGNLCSQIEQNSPTFNDLFRLLSLSVNMLLSPVTPALPRKMRQEIDNIMGNMANAHFLSTICLPNRSSDEYFIRTMIVTATIFPETKQGGSELEECGKGLAKKQRGFGAWTCIWEPETYPFQSQIWLRSPCDHERGHRHSVSRPFSCSGLRLMTLPSLLAPRPKDRGMPVDGPGDAEGSRVHLVLPGLDSWPQGG